MTQIEILNELKHFSLGERIKIIDETLHSVVEDLKKKEPYLTRTEKRKNLEKAAKALLSEYKSNPELTSFTSLNGNDFYEQR